MRMRDPHGTGYGPMLAPDGTVELGTVGLDPTVPITQPSAPWRNWSPPAMVNRLHNAILAPFAGRNDPSQASNADRLNQAWQATVGAGQAAASAHLEAQRNSQMLQCQSDVLARDAQEFQAEQRVSQLEQDGLQLRN